MKIIVNALVGCEFSKTVRDSLRSIGINAYSCDLEEATGGNDEWHLQMDVFEAIKMRKWDLIILHPPCTALTLAGNRVYATGKKNHQDRLNSAIWTEKLWNLAIKECDHVCLENPKGVLNKLTNLPKPQIIQPYFFGDEFQKTTCLWLHGLPRLHHVEKPDLFNSEITHVYRGDMVVYPSGNIMPKWFASTPTSGDNKKNRAIRNKTFPGIAKAIANQWGKLLIQKYNS